ncbi:ECF transporter S component [Planctomonas psychrotolerans]|uniref:ECF transporter S component n=1 Tax=Planctomonas psychrotolerans TaxID=2528712 RepID=UPI001239B4BD|nr:ECF transporter S component [Planctomonas psychrotolerans]
MSDDRLPGHPRDSDDRATPDDGSAQFTSRAVPVSADDVRRTDADGPTGPDAQRAAVEHAPDETLAVNAAPKVPTAEPPLLNPDSSSAEAAWPGNRSADEADSSDHPVTSPTETIVTSPADDEPADNRYAGWYESVDPSGDDDGNAPTTPMRAAPVSAASAAAGASVAAGATPTAPTVAAPTVVAPAVPVAAPSPQSGPQYVHNSPPPHKKSNRGVGLLIALLSALVFGLLFAVGAALLASITNPAPFDALLARYVAEPVFWIPVLVFFGAFALLVLILNRANWWAFVLGGFPVALIVYAAYIGARLIQQDFVQLTPAEAALVVQRVSTFPDGILAAVLAREIVIWAGAAISARGRTVKARNAEARAEYDRQLAGMSGA